MGGSPLLGCGSGAMLAEGGWLCRRTRGGFLATPSGVSAGSAPTPRNVENAAQRSAFVGRVSALARTDRAHRSWARGVAPALAGTGGGGLPRLCLIPDSGCLIAAGQAAPRGQPRQRRGGRACHAGSEWCPHILLELPHEQD